MAAARRADFGGVERLLVGGLDVGDGGVDRGAGLVRGLAGLAGDDAGEVVAVVRRERAVGEAAGQYGGDVLADLGAGRRAAGRRAGGQPI